MDKGEWSVSEGTEGALLIIRTLPNGGVTQICNVRIPSTGYREEAEANAELIAAAPAFYEALEAVVSCADRYGAGPGEREAFDKVKAAIAKADSK